MRNRLRSPVHKMAAIKEFGDEISDQFLVCKICFETYRNPKSLSCLHTFCAGCLEQYLRAEVARSQSRYVIYARGITCPVCRKRTELPSGGVRHLPDNFLVSNLTEVVNRSKPASRSTMCDFCYYAGRPSKVAQSKCVECNKNMCKNCSELHKRTKVTRNHTTFAMKSENSVVCKIHSEEPLRFFCQPCETCICVACTFREHYGHEVTSFGDGISQYVEDMEKMTTLCRSKMSTIKNHLDVINRCEDNINKVEDHIKTLASNLIVNIRVQQRMLLDEIRQFYGSEALELLDNKEELEQIMDNLASTCELANFVLRDKDVEFLLLHKEVRDKMKSLIDLDLAQLPDAMFRELKFVQGGMFFGYIDSGKEVSKVEFDVQPSEQLPQIIRDRLAIRSSIMETQTQFNDLLKDTGTTMDSHVRYVNFETQTDDPVIMTRRGSTQTLEASTKCTGTCTDAPVLRSRSQNTEKRESLQLNCASQTNIELVDSLSQCHPVVSVSMDIRTDHKPKMENAACGTEVLTTTTSGTTTEDLEMELISKYMEMMESGEPHSPPYNIPFPVDILDRCSPTSETVPILTHILNTVQKVDQCTNVPSVTNITAGMDIELADVMLKDSGTNTDFKLTDFDDSKTDAKFTDFEDSKNSENELSTSTQSDEAPMEFNDANTDDYQGQGQQSVYTYSDSYSESSPDDSANTSHESISPLSDEDRFTDQSTLIDKDDLIQILAGEALVQWDEQSALHDMIILDRLRSKQAFSTVGMQAGTSTRDQYTDSEPEMSLLVDEGTSTEDLNVVASTSEEKKRSRSWERVKEARERFKSRSLESSSDQSLELGKGAKDSFRNRTRQVPKRPTDSSFKDVDSDSAQPEDSDTFLDAEDWQNNDLLDTTDTETSEDASHRKKPVETGYLTEKLESLFSMSKLLAMTRKLDRRPSQTAGLVSEVAKKLERRMSGEEPQRRLSATQRPSISDVKRPELTALRLDTRARRDSGSPRNVYIFSPHVQGNDSPSRSPTRSRISPSRSLDLERYSPVPARSETHPSVQKLAEMDHKEALNESKSGEGQSRSNETMEDKDNRFSKRRNLARVRKPDISALLNLKTVKVDTEIESEPEGRLVPGPNGKE